MVLINSLKKTTEPQKNCSWEMTGGDLVQTPVQAGAPAGSHSRPW